MHEMPSQLDDIKPRKRKCSSEVRVSRKVSTGAKGRKKFKSQKMQSSAEESSALKSSKSADKLSRISCECHEAADRRRCLSSPELEGQEGKENELRSEQDVSSCKANSVFEEQTSECMESENNSRNLFPDDDSNQILPVEQFFGNLDIVQNFPKRSPAISPSTRREERSRHYYAQEDSDGEEVSLGRLQRDDEAGT